MGIISRLGSHWFCSFSRIVWLVCCFFLPSDVEANNEDVKSEYSIKVGVYRDGWGPFQVGTSEYSINTGFSLELLATIATKLGYQLEFVPFKRWSDIFEAACRGDIQVVPDVYLTSQVSSCLSLSTAYYNSPNVVIGNRRTGLVLKPDILFHESIAIEKGVPAEVQLRHWYPDNSLISFTTIREALRAVAIGKAEVFIGNLHIANKLLRQYPDLKVLGKAPLPHDGLHFGIPHRYSSLSKQLQTALKALDREYIDELADEWLKVNVGKEVQNGELILRPDEMEWLNDLGPLSFTVLSNRPPYSSFYADHLLPEGMFPDYLSYISKKLSIELNFKLSKDWSDRLSLAQTENVDIVPLPRRMQTELPEWSFSDPILTFPLVAVTKNTYPTLENFRELRHSKVLIADPILKEELERILGDVDVSVVNGPFYGMQQVANGKADAYIGDLAVVGSMIRDYFPSDLKITSTTPLKNEFVIAVRDEYAKLIPLINRVLEDMDDSDRWKIRNTWLAVKYQTGFSWLEAVIKIWPFFLLGLLIFSILISAYFHTRKEMKRRAEAEFIAKDSQQRLLDVTRRLPAVVFQLKLSEGNFKLTYVGGRPIELWGVDGDELLVTPGLLSSYIYPADRYSFMAELQRSAKTLSSLPVEIRIMVTDSLRWFRCETDVQQLPDGDILWSGYCIDIEDERAKSKALSIAKESAEQAAKAKADFLARMSHEIRTPMNGILGMGELLKFTQLDIEQEQMVGSINDAAVGLLQLLDSILDFSKIDAGKLELEYHCFNLRELLDSVVSMTANAALNKGLEFKLYIDHRIKELVVGDSLRIRQVLFNLVSNAIKFTTSGYVEIRVELPPNSEDKLLLSVTDSGVGIEEDAISTVFEAFKQAQETTSREYGGTGLGLAISHQLANLMGGALNLHSQKGVGTQAQLSIPVMFTETQKRSIFTGDRVQITVADIEVREALAQLLLAMGMILVDNDADLLFTMNLQNEIKTPQVLLTKLPEGVGFRIEKGQWLLNLNPLSWGGLQRVCALALNKELLESEPEQIQYLSSKRLLVVEDQVLNRVVIERQLRQLGLECDLVENGQEALDRLNLHSYPLILCDCQMPVMDGYTFTQFLRQQELVSGGHLPVIAMTANVMAHQRQLCLDAGMDDVLSKPIKLDALQQMLESWMPVFDTKKIPEPTLRLDLGILSAAFGSKEATLPILEAMAQELHKELYQFPGIEADAAELVPWVHRCAGSLGLLGLTQEAEKGWLLEDAIKQGESVTESLEVFYVTIGQLRELIKAYLKENA